jgi:group I intron endonuclease
MDSGVYSIINTKTGQVYIGSSQNVRKRWTSHRHQLRKGSHENARLQRAWIKYGEDYFSFGLLESAGLAELLEVEQAWIDIMPCHVSQGGYNISPTAGNCIGVKHTDEMKAKISAIHKGVPKSPEHRRLIGESQRGKEIPAEQREKLRQAAKSQMQSPGMREKLSAAKKGRPAKNKGVSMSSEQRAKLSEIRKAFYSTPDGMEQLDKMRELSRSPEARAKASSAKLGKRATIETRLKMSAAHKGKAHPRRSTPEWLAGMKARAGKRAKNSRSPSPELVGEMKRLRAEGISFAKVAEATGKSLQTVFRWCHRTD